MVDRLLWERVVVVVVLVVLGACWDVAGIVAVMGHNRDIAGEVQVVAVVGTVGHRVTLDVVDVVAGEPASRMSHRVEVAVVDIVVVGEVGLTAAMGGSWIRCSNE